MGLPVPPGFIVTTAAHKDIIKSDETRRTLGSDISQMGLRNLLPTSLTEECKAAMQRLERATDRIFGGTETRGAGFISSIATAFAVSSIEWKSPHFPLLVSVRSTAPISLPGMLDTVLNVGMNAKALHSLIEATGNPLFAYDVYRRFLESFGSVVYGISRDQYETLYHSRVEESRNVSGQSDLDTVKEIVSDFLLLTGKVPDDPYDQLNMVLLAVFNSWDSSRATSYREMKEFDSCVGTAAIIQSMVYGNLNMFSGAGLCITRNPCNGERKLFGEFFPGCEGDSISKGYQEPTEIDQILPCCYESLIRIQSLLEKKFRDVQAVEFTIENSVLYVLQAKPASMSAIAAVRCAQAFATEGLLSECESLLRINANHLKMFCLPIVDNSFSKYIINCERHRFQPYLILCSQGVSHFKSSIVGSGLPAAPGAVVGKLAFTLEDAIAMASDGNNIIMCTQTASVEDIRAFEVI
jgi:pyruvate,orthophosphate dikinase